MLGAWVRQRAIILCCYYCTLITPAAKITGQLAYTVNYPLRFDQSRTGIKFEYIINYILGRSEKQDVTKEIKLNGKTVTSAKELVHDCFLMSILSISLPIRLRMNENDGRFRDYINSPRF